MKRSFTRLLCCAAAFAALSNLAPTAVAQNAGVLLPLPPDVDTQSQLTRNRGLAPGASVSGAAVPLTAYSVVASDGNTYTGTLVGTSPFDGSGLSTTVNTPIIPVVLAV